VAQRLVVVATLAGLVVAIDFFLGLMALAAFRYCQGRMTYIVGDCERWIFANWEHFPENVKKLIQREVEKEINRDDEARERGDDYKPLGHDCDRAAWERVASLWRK
jgi:hypothetical protein